MSRSGRIPSSNVGYRSWFNPFRYNERIKIPIFVLDFETDSLWEEGYDSDSDYEDNKFQSKTKLVNGVQLYFLDENLVKRKAFLRHEPYFYLLLEEGLSKRNINRIIANIKEKEEKHVTRVETVLYYDAEYLTFLNKKPFLKVIVDHPSSVSRLRTEFEEINGIVEWREADVLFHHRVAIDHNVHVGSWYSAYISGGEIQALSIIPNKAPPKLRILAFDIETVFEPTQEPNPNRDAISMLVLFTGDELEHKNILIVNSQVVKIKDVKDFYIVLRKSDEKHSKPWVDWEFNEGKVNLSSALERFPVNVIIAENEKELLDHFYSFIQQFQPDVLTDFFGDRFDIPFLAIRSEKYSISFEKETGFRIILKHHVSKNKKEAISLGEIYSPNNIDYVSGAGIIHLDAFLFNEKYSYLPKKDLGLKPSVEKKLKIIPIGREALFALKENPVEAVAYSGCDGYITWKYVHEIVLDFFISMGQMFPVPASELLTRRTGSLDDLLIDSEDHKHKIIGRRRIDQKNIESFSSGVVIESVAYTGGLVDARRPGIFRSDIYQTYKSNKEALDKHKELIRNIIEKEGKKLVKKISKEEFHNLLAIKLGDNQISYSDDTDLFLCDIEANLIKNGVSKDKLDNQLEYVRDTLEKISTIYIENINEVINEIYRDIDQISKLNGKTQLRGVHVDVTSMYPSQIRQNKLQPSSIVPLTMCQTCDLKEADDTCFIEGDWVIKISAHRPCKYRLENSTKCGSNICTSQKELNCKKYEPLQNNNGRSQEIFTFDGKKTEAFVFVNSIGLKQESINQTYLGGNIISDPFIEIQKWLRNNIKATQLTTKLDQNRFDIFDDQPDDFIIPKNSFMSLDVRSKKITILLSVNSRVCQKAYNFIARIMDDFFNTRVSHKIESQRLKQIISQKTALNKPIQPELLQKQKFHDSTQLGMKVPLNSIYGLLGMKGGVRNASAPCAGITTKLSADLIYWTSEQLEQIGMVTELDTDGIWLWIPILFPISFNLTVIIPYKENKRKSFNITLIDKILNSKVSNEDRFRNDNYWTNDGNKIVRTCKNLINFEQDGPYDFQFVMGKKKYIVYSFDKKNKAWIEKELTGLESKRADFSQLQKNFQEQIIKAYLENFDPDNPITLEELYRNAVKKADEIKIEMLDGRMDPSFFVKPKAINKPLNAYKSKLPQITAAYILKDLGFSVEPGTRIQMLNIKGNHVIPKQIFDFDFKRIKEVLIKHEICKLSFLLGELSSKEDLNKLIDVKQYIEDIFGPGRIYDRMIRYPMDLQKVFSPPQKILHIKELKKISRNEKKNKTEKEEISGEEHLIKNAKKNIKSNRDKKLSSNTSQIVLKRKTNDSYKKRKKKIRDLNDIFSLGKKREDIKSIVDEKLKGQIQINNSKGEKINEVKEKKLHKKDIKRESKSFPNLNTEKPDEMASLLSIDEISELETNNFFRNGSNSTKDDYNLEEDQILEDTIICSECGALVNPHEITNEGCIFCGGRKIF